MRTSPMGTAGGVTVDLGSLGYNAASGEYRGTFTNMAWRTVRPIRVTCVEQRGRVRFRTGTLSLKVCHRALPGGSLPRVVSAT